MSGEAVEAEKKTAVAVKEKESESRFVMPNMLIVSI